MDIIKTLLGVISVLLTIIAFFLRAVWADVKDMKKDIEARTLILDCKQTHTELNKDRHVHGRLGKAGEVIHK